MLVSSVVVNDGRQAMLSRRLLTMPLVAERHQKGRVRYAEGEHEPRWLMVRNTSAYRVVVPFTDQWGRYLGARG